MLEPASAILLLACAAQGAPAAGRGWDGFPVIVYRQEYSGREAPASLLEPFGGVHVRGSEAADWVLARGLDFYVEFAAGRDALYLSSDDPRWKAREEHWLATRDPRWLVREPCLTDPATVAAIEAELDRSLAARGGKFGLGYSLGDEVSLVPGGAPSDVCLSPTCRAAWTRFLERNGLAEEARAQGFAELERCSTQAALSALGAGRTLELRGWILRRRFHHEVVVELLGRLAARARAASPGAPLGLVGLAGESPFANVAVERALELVDFIETYRTADATELLFTLRGPEQRALATIFPVGPDACAWVAWEHWTRGGDGLVVWCDRDLERSSALAGRFARAVASIRALDERLPAFRPRPTGVALLHSSDAIAIDWLLDAEDDGDDWPARKQTWQEAHGRLPLAIRAWLEALEDCGAMPGALPLGEVGAGTVERFPLLVATELTVLDEPDLERIASYLRAGGRLIVDGDFARFDSRGVRFDPPAQARLERAAAGRVLRPPPDLARYAERRDEATRAVLSGMLLLAGTERAPWRFTGACAEMPFRCTFQLDPATGTWTCATLPKFPRLSRSREPRSAELRALRLELEPPPGTLIRWLHPPGDGAAAPTLAPGDAAVFTLSAGSR